MSTFNPKRPPRPRRPGPEHVASPRLRHATATTTAAAPPLQDEAALRLSKRMAQLGLASRREADEWISRGWVLVDGVVVSELGSKVLPHQRIEIKHGAQQEKNARITVLLNKPLGYVSGQAEDGHTPAIALITAENHWAEDASHRRFERRHLLHLAPAGRLDIDSIGLLVLTQDGVKARQLIGEDSEVEKEYLVRVSWENGATPIGSKPLPQRFPAAQLALLHHGLSLDGKALKPARVSWQNDDQLRFVLREGKKRQIRRMCELVGLKVLGLKRVRIGRIPLGDLPLGQWRYLLPEESFV